jgi:hypothetical protein
VSAARWNVRRFAAIDMHGTAGTQRRRRLVTVEFVLGTAVLILIGARSPSHGGWLFAGWLLGCGANYGALSVHAVRLYRPGRLEAELDGVDVRSELRRYSIAQLLLFVPALIAVIALAQALGRGGGRGEPDGIGPGRPEAR